MNGSLVALQRRRLLVVGLAILLVLNVGNAASIYALCILEKDFAFGIVPLFNFDTEGNFPTLFNGLLLAFGSFLGFSISRSLSSGGGSPLVSSWKAVGFVLGFMCLDELCHIHEAIGWILMTRVETDGAISWPWVIPYALLTLAVVAFFARFFFRLERKYQVYLAVAGGLYVFGAIGLEMFEAKHVEGVLAAGESDKHGKDSLGFCILYTIEENLEMIAVMIANSGFMAYAMEHCNGLNMKVRVEP